MLVRLAADTVVTVHFAFVAFVLLGAWLALRWRWIVWLHVPAWIWGAAVEFFGLICPLTPLEQRLRQAAGEQGYPGGFVEHYLVAALYPSNLTERVQVGLGVLVVAVNVIAYAIVLTRNRR